MATIDTLLTLSKQLTPQGRAFLMSPGSTYERFVNARNLRKGQAYDDAVAILNSIIPDNDFFTEADATAWERRLGIIGSNAITLTDRKAAIFQKMNYPGDRRPRCSAQYLEHCLQLAGYDVHVYENRFYEGSPAAWITKTPAEVLGFPIGTATLDGFNLGDLDLDSSYALYGASVIANYIEEIKDSTFPVTNYRSTFFIAGETITTFANVDLARKDNFRQLILQLKPLQTVGFLFLNYV